jgi:hypothetical protein
MNSPQPVPSTGTNLAPTIGSLVGGAAGLAVVGKLGLNPLDPYSGGSILVAITTLFTAAFHWLGKKTGIPGLG